MDKRFSLKFLLTLVFSASAFTAGLLILAFHFFPGSDSQDDFTRSDRLDELLYVIEQRFIGEFDSDELFYSAMSAAVFALDDHWSYFITTEDYLHILETEDNQYVGIGVEVLIDDLTGGVRVIGVFRQSGAYDAGIMPGDIIVGVDNDSIIGFTLDELRESLRRPIDDTVLLRIIRSDVGYIDKTVVYRLVFADPITFELVSPGIGLISISNFELGAADSFMYAVSALLDMGATSFIYDVRSNPGGRLNEMTAILDFLLPEGVIFTSVRRTDGELTVQEIRSDEHFFDYPAVVIVNSRSFSAAEYFAAILAEYYYAYTVGEQTTGKNRLQSTIPLTGGGAVHLSTGEYLTKNGVSLYDIGGYTPQFIVEMSIDDYFLFRRGELDLITDLQLAKAITLLS